MATPADGNTGGALVTQVPQVTQDKLTKPGFMERVRFALTGKAPDGWFGPGTRMAPIAPEEQKGRQFDYPFAVNVPYQPRGETGENAIGFDTLRRMADPLLGGLDLLRLAIETRKDQMSAQKWSIRKREATGAGGEKGRAIAAALARPDGVNTFRAWQRMLLEDLLVIDAPAIYINRTKGQPELPSQTDDDPNPDDHPEPMLHTADDVGVRLDVVDGATIKRLLNQDGRTPMPPDPAYLQAIKGVPAFEYTTEELLYIPRNVRSNRIYGCSPVEQVVTTVNIALRRQLSQLEYYTKGNIPDMGIGVPETWTPAQIAEFQTYFDTVLTGDTAARRQVRFFPGGATPFPFKDPKIKDEWDEWLARIICFAFSLSPQALVKEMNRATAETSQEAAVSEGLEPLKLWFKDAMDTALAVAFDAPEMEFVFQDEEINDPQTKITVYGGLVTAGIATVNEARKAYGLEPMDGQDELKAANTLTDPMAEGTDTADEADPQDPEAVAADGEDDPEQTTPDEKKKPVATSTKGKKSPRRSLRRIAPKHFDKEGVVTRRVLAVFEKQLSRVLEVLGVEKAAGDRYVSDADLQAILRALPLKDAMLLEDALAGHLGQEAQNAAEAAVQQVAQAVTIPSADYRNALDQANEKAATWAKSYSGTLITGVMQTTVDHVRDAVQDAIDNGNTVAELRDVLLLDPAFQGSRAEMIARTELAFANVKGNLIGWTESGQVESKKWIVGANCCEECAMLHGVVIGIDEMFDWDGEEIDGPPAHPNCRCDVVPVLGEPDAEESE